MTRSAEVTRWSLAYYTTKLPEEPDVYPVFLSEIDAAARAGANVLDLGCGGEFILQHLAGRVGRLAGLDVEKRDHPYDELIVADLREPLPLADGSLDLVVCKFLFEHLREPERAAGEIARVLAPGGRTIVLTPDVRYFPYAANFLLSRLLPQGIRMRFVEHLTGRPSSDIYPVFYHCNTPRRLRKVFEDRGLAVRRLDTFSDFRAIAGWKVLGIAGTWYEIVLNRLKRRGPRGFILGVFEKEGDVDTAV